MQKAAKREILKVVDDYKKGCFRGDYVMLRSVFHEKAVCCGFWESQMVLGKPDLFIQGIAAAPTMESLERDYHLDVDQVFIMDDIASVIVTESGFGGDQRLVDCFHLIRDDGMWFITSKLFTTC